MAQAYLPEDVTDVEDVYLCMCKQNNKVIIGEWLNRDRGYKAHDILHIPVPQPPVLSYPVLTYSISTLSWIVGTSPVSG